MIGLVIVATVILSAVFGMRALLNLNSRQKAAARAAARSSGGLLPLAAPPAAASQPA
jgi:hypothetical protein